MLTSLLKRVIGGRTAGGDSRPAPAVSARAERLSSAIAAQSRGDSRAAEAIYLELIEESPHDADALHLLGHLYRIQKRHGDAADLLARAAAARPEAAHIHFELGLACSDLHDVESAVRAYERALELQPDFAAALNNLASVNKARGDPDAVERCYRRLLELDPAFAIGHSELGNALLAQGRVDEAIASFRAALAIDGTCVAAHTNLLYALNFHPGYTPVEIFDEHRAWARRFAEPLLASAPPVAARVAERKLRVGYVSPNFFDHPVAYFFEPTLKHHDFEAFDVFCYSDVRQPDAVTERLRRYGTWRDTHDLDDEQLAQRVRDDRVDILVDLTGHTNDNRLLVFARKPAPVQVTWNGYANTTGMGAMDYRLSDPYADPPGATDDFHSEKLLRLPEVYMAFEPPRSSPPVLERGAQERVSFASCNVVSKIGPQVIAVWARILHAAPASRLAMYTVPEGNARARLGAAFEAHGIGSDRLEFHRRLPLDEFLGAIGSADIALDPFPFAGTTTTCYTLWMGLPVITLAGAAHASRVGVSFLTNVGLPELVAADEDEYVRLAVALASDPARLAALRAGLRARMLESPLTDGKRLTRHLEAAYRDAWNEYHVRPS